MGKEEGRVVGLWPGQSLPSPLSNITFHHYHPDSVYHISGSCLHAIRALQHPRWEDFEYTRIDRTRNRLYWLGDGSTWNEKTMTGDRKSIILWILVNDSDEMCGRCVVSQ